MRFIDVMRKCGDTFIPVGTIAIACLPENHEHYEKFNGNEGMTTEPFTAHQIKPGYVGFFIKSDKNPNISIDVNIHEKYLILHREFSAADLSNDLEEIKLYNLNVVTSKYHPDKPFCIRKGTTYLLCKTMHEARVKIKTFWSDRTAT